MSLSTFLHDSLFNQLFNMSDFPVGRMHRSNQFYLDMHENSDNYVVKADLPGFEKQNIKINIEKGVLTISGTRENTEKVNNENYHYLERSYGSVSRSLYLPNNVDEEHINAVYENGVLSLTIPKTEVQKRKMITIS